MALVNPDSFSSTAPSVDEESSNWFLDWLKNLGQDFYDHTTAGTSSALEGAYNVQQAIGGNDVPITNSYNEARSDITFDDLFQDFKDGKITATELFEAFASKGIKLTPMQQDLMNLILDKEARGEEYNREIQYILDSFKATQEAAAKAGLNTSSYLMSQGASSGIGAGKADVDGLEASKNRSRDEFQYKTQAAMTLMRMLGTAASVGIHGASMYAARKAVAGLTTSATLDAARMRMRTGRIHINPNGIISKDIYEY